MRREWAYVNGENEVTYANTRKDAMLIGSGFEQPHARNAGRGVYEVHSENGDMSGFVGRIEDMIKARFDVVVTEMELDFLESIGHEFVKPW